MNPECVNYQKEINTPAKIRDQILFLRPNIAFFSSINQEITHGFAWGKNTPNYSYAKEPGFPNQEAIDNVKNRVSIFLDNLNLALNDKTIIIQSPITDQTIFEINQHNLKKLNKTDHGLLAQAGAIITTQKDITLTVPPGDCRWGIISSKTFEDKPMLSLIHHSREHLDSHFITKFINYLKLNYGCNPNDIKVALTPGLSQKYHKLSFNGLKNSADWGSFVKLENDGFYYVDTLNYAIDQYHQNNIHQIETYSDLFCTYDSALKNDFIASHRFCMDIGKPEIEGRILIAAKLN